MDFNLRENSPLYELNSKLLSSSLQVHPVGLKNITFNDGLDAQWHLILGDYSQFKFPLRFHHAYGNKMTDILDTGWPGMYLISKFLKSTFIDQELTGWKTYPVEVFDNKGTKIEGYSGLSITGKTGPIDFTQSEIVQQRLVAHGPISKYYKGLYPKMEEWDGSDFFLANGYFGIIMTDRAASVFRKSRLSNVKVQPLEDIEMSDFTVQTALKNRAKS